MNMVFLKFYGRFKLNRLKINMFMFIYVYILTLIIKYYSLTYSLTETFTQPDLICFNEIYSR